MSLFFLILLFAHFTKIDVTCKCLLQIQLKFGTFIRGPKANLSIKFGINLMHILRVMILCVKKSNFCHAYKLNRLEEQVKNQYEASEGCLLVVSNELSRRLQRYSPTLVKSNNRFLHNIKKKSFSLYHTNHIKE